MTNYILSHSHYCQHTTYYSIHLHPSHFFPLFFLLSPPYQKIISSFSKTSLISTYKIHKPLWFPLYNYISPLLPPYPFYSPSNTTFFPFSNNRDYFPFPNQLFWIIMTQKVIHFPFKIIKFSFLFSMTGRFVSYRRIYLRSFRTIYCFNHIQFLLIFVSLHLPSFLSLHPSIDLIKRNSLQCNTETPLIKLGTLYVSVYRCRFYPLHSSPRPSFSRRYTFLSFSKTSWLIHDFRV